MQTNIENNYEYQDFSSIPATDAAYYEAINGGFDDSNYFEPAAVTAPLYAPKATTPQNNQYYRLDGFDILNRADSELTALAAACEIDWQALKPLINRGQTKYKKGIALTKKARGSCIVFVHFKITHGGLEYPHITFKTFKNGGITEVFNGYEFARDNGLFDNKAFSESEKQIYKAKQIEREQQQAKRAELAKQQQFYSQEQTLKRFNDFQKRFDNALKNLKDTTGTYLERKGFSKEFFDKFVSTLNRNELYRFKKTLVQLSKILKRGHDKDGGFIAYELKNNHKIVGTQKIYDTPPAWLPKGKYNNLLPNTKNGSYAMLGKPKNQQDIIYLCEGLATALAVYLATGKPVIIALDANNLFHVAKTQSKIFKNLTIAADNDIKELGNTGLYHALITAKAFNLEIVYPQLLNGEKCDFNDLMNADGLNEVKSQLKTNKLDFSESSVYYNRLLEYCLIQNQKELKKHFNSACFIAANHLLLNNQDDIKNAALSIQNIIDSRKLTLNNEPINATKQIEYFLIKKLFEIKKANGLINLEKIIIHNFNNRKLKIELNRLFNRLYKIVLVKTNNDTQFAKKISVIAKVEKRIKELKAQIQKPVIEAIKKNNKAIWLLDWQMGEGKTEIMKVIVDLVKQKNQRTGNTKQITYIAHRVALIKDASNRLSLSYYEDVAWYAGERPSTLATTANSILNHAVSDYVNVLFIDEIRQTLEHILNGTCDNRLEVFNQLIAAIQNADLVLCADADLNQFTLDWIKGIANKPLHLSTSEIIKNHKKIIELKTNGELFGKIREDLLSGKKAWITTDSKSKAKNIDEFLTLENDNEIAIELKTLFNDEGLNLTEDDILLVTSENKADVKQALFLANPDKESKKYRVIIHTPVISSGVSVINGCFNSVYAIFCNVTAPNEMLQTIARVRTAKTIYCTFKTGHNKNRVTNLYDLVDGELKKLERFSLNTKEAIKALDYFDRLRLESMVNKNKALNDFKPYFFLLAQQKGYDVLPYKELNDIDSESEKKLTDNLKKISSVVKQKEISIIKNDTQIIDSNEAIRLEKLNALTQQQTNAVKRFKVCQWTGKESKEDNPKDITDADIDFIIFNKGSSIIANYELLTADLSDLKEQDNLNYLSRDKLASKASKHLLFKTVIDGINGLENATFDSATAGKICEFLQDHHQELTSNGLGNYKKVSKYPVRQLTEFLAKCGYDVLLVKKDDGVRWYSIAENERAKSYAEARAYQRNLKNIDADM
jgi:hypothetical protein